MGGPPTIAIRLAAAQAGLGHTVRVVSYAFPNHERILDERCSSVPWRERVQFDMLPEPSLGEKVLARHGRQRVRELIADVDVVHLHSVWESVLVVSAAEARAAGKPYFVLLNGMLDPWSLRQKGLKKRLALALAHRKMLEGASALHVGNDDERKLIEPMGLRVNTVIIPNGVCLEEIEPLPARGSFRASRPALDGHPYVLFLSRLHYKKGLNYLADAFRLAAARLPHLHLVAAGPDDGERAVFEARIREANLQDRVHVVGPLYSREKFAAMVDADCFCLPSHQEGFSVAICEALACHTPVVISEGCHFPEVAEVGAGVLVKLDPQQISEEIVRICSDSTLRRDMGQAGNDLIRSRLTWPRIAQLTVEKYQAALATSVRQPN